MVFKMWLNFKPRKSEKRLKMFNNGGLHSCIRWTLISSRLMGLFPLSGLWQSSANQLRFTLRSPYTIFYMLSLFGQSLLFGMSFYWFLFKKISLPNVTNSFFYSSSFISSIILLTIGRHWPKVIKEVEEIETQLPPFSRNVAKRCNITMICILFAALLEHLFSVNYGIIMVMTCSPDNVAERYFHYVMPWVFDYTPYAVWKGVIVEILNIQSTFIWSFNDVLIMVISIYLTEHFIVHDNLLRRAVIEEHFSAAIFRVQYLKIVRLIKVTNGQVGIYILTSFGSNLYWICVQLFNSLNKGQTANLITCRHSNPKVNALQISDHTIYFLYSFSFLAVRTLMVLLLAARIHSNSKTPLISLYGLPSQKFNIEVERYIAQINNIKVALTGLDFFYVTRTMILTLLGTIVTYELVLLQFNA